MINDNFSENLIEKIKEVGVAPTPKWQFLLKDYIVWIFGCLSLIIGGLATSVMIYLLVNNDWQIYTELTDSFFAFFLLTLPYFWILFLIFFTLVAYYNLKHTKKGYRFSLWIVVSVVVLASLVLGVVFSGLGLGEEIDEILSEKTSFYPQVFGRHIDMWSMPERGRLSGLLVDRKGDSSFILLDRDRMEWELVISERTKVFDKIDIRRPIKIIGEKQSKNVFEAFEILPMGPGRGMFNNFNRRMPQNMEIIVIPR